MNKLMTVTVSFAALAGAMMFSIPASAESGRHDPVYDFRGNLIHDFRGNCVRTIRWDDAQDACGKAAPRKQMHTYKRPYIVFFDWDRANLTSQAQGIVNKLFRDGSRAKRARYHIVGHADRSGSDNYNMGLSKKRASAVKNALIRLGVPAAHVSTDFKGERQPLVATKDGVREPQNRRSEITLTVEENK